MAILKMILMVVLCFLVAVEKALTYAQPQGPVDEHDRLDDISKIVLGKTVVQLQSSGANPEQYMLTANWIALDVNSEWQVHVKAYYEMVLQWLEDLVRGEKSRETVKNAMTREWKKMEESIKPYMIERFIGFQLINEMANAK